MHFKGTGTHFRHTCSLPPCRAVDPVSAAFYRRVLLSFVAINQHATNLLLVAMEVALHA